MSIHRSVDGSQHVVAVMVVATRSVAAVVTFPVSLREGEVVEDGRIIMSGSSGQVVGADNKINAYVRRVAVDVITLEEVPPKVL